MKKKAYASTRNRHSGKVNAYKQSVIDKGRKVEDSRGVTYAVSTHKKLIDTFKTVNVSQVVRIK